MPRRTFPLDRFDDLPADAGRVGAHRAENPRMRGGVVLLWALLATLILVAVGIFGTLIVTGRVVLGPPEGSPTTTSGPSVAPVVDTSYSVLILNATPEQGLATQFKNTLVATGWSADNINAGDAGTADFAETTVFYAFPADEAAAAGLAETIGGAKIEQSDVYIKVSEPEGRQLTIVIGLDRTSNSPATSAP